MKKALIAAGAIFALVIVSVGGLLAYRVRQDRLCFKTAGPAAIGACTAYIEKKGVFPLTAKNALARRSELYAGEKKLELALADGAKAIEIQLPDMEAQKKHDRPLLGARIELASSLRRFDIVAQACDALGGEAKEAREHQSCAMSYFLTGRDGDAARESWKRLAGGAADPDMVLLAALSSYFSGDPARAVEALHRVDVTALPPRHKAGLVLIESDMFTLLGAPREGLALLDSILRQPQGLGGNDIKALMMRRHALLNLLGREAEAVSVLDNVLQGTAAPDERVTLLIMRGQGREALGQFAGAVADFREAAAADPKRISPHRGLGAVLVRKKSLAEAELEFKAALRLLEAGKDDPVARLGAAYCSLALRRDKKAAGEQMAKALSGDLGRIPHSKTFKLMLAALVRDPRLKALSRTYEGNILAIPTGAAPTIDMKAYAGKLRGLVQQHFEASAMSADIR